MPLNDSAQGLHFAWIVDTMELYQFGITAPWERSHHVQYVGDAGRHASAKVLPGVAKDDDHTSCHIFTSMRAYTLYHCQRTAIAYGEALTSTARGEELAPGRSIEHGIAENDVLVCNETSINGWRNNNLAPCHALAHVIIGLTVEDQVHAGQAKRTKALSRRAVEYTGHAYSC